MNIRIRSRLAAACALALVLWPYAISFGDGGASVTLTNRTRYYLHITVNNRTYLYVAPGGVVQDDLATFADVVVDVEYSPGQGVAGSASRVLEPVRYDSQGRTSTCTSGSTSSGDNCASTTESTSSVSPVRWDITPEDFAVM